MRDSDKRYRIEIQALGVYRLLSTVPDALESTREYVRGFLKTLDSKKAEEVVEFIDFLEVLSVALQCYRSRYINPLSQTPKMSRTLLFSLESEVSAALDYVEERRVGLE